MSDRWELVPVTQLERRELIAAWLCWRWRTVAREEGVQVAARRLRRYGIPIAITLRVLGIEPTAAPRRLSNSAATHHGKPGDFAR